MKRLLTEAEAMFRALPPGVPKTLDEASARAYKFLKLSRFLTQAFVAPAAKDLLDHTNREYDRHREAGQHYEVDASIADHIADLASRFTMRDLDFGFSLPRTFAEYVERDNWAPNARPIPADERPPS